MDKKRSITLQSLRSSHVMLGNDGGHGHERPDTLITINVVGKVLFSDFVEVSGEEIYVQLSLSPKQVAHIVKLFFWDITTESIFGKMLKRLLKKRWAVMTWPVYKTASVISEEEDVREMRYCDSEK